MKFIRVHGRVVPIREKNELPGQKNINSGANTALKGIAVKAAANFVGKQQFQKAIAHAKIATGIKVKAGGLAGAGEAFMRHRATARTAMRTAIGAGAVAGIGRAAMAVGSVQMIIGAVQYSKGVSARIKKAKKS